MLMFDVEALPDKRIMLVEDIRAPLHKTIKRDNADPEKRNPDAPENYCQAQQEKESSDSITSRIPLYELLKAPYVIGG